MKPGESCYICKAPDHSAKDCPTKSEWEKNKSGHSLKNCRNKNEESFEKKSCCNCGETSHSLDKCPQPLQDVPPAYYSHLAAFRARFYMEPDTSDSGSMTSGAAGGRGAGGSARSARVAGANAAVRPLPQLRENVKRVKFYC
ncbi:unnamed protein product [Fraxinus pennsylvanica]|uniref:CCHC-type domain-containing protein n=1 Tax=Fraxinus pennsylvanica TaxID=56036 RepID=A0AAD1ZM21_9LAMI|nr:unnamed protein product [Fraxinus pennsylvanica]